MFLFKEVNVDVHEHVQYCTCSHTLYMLMFMFKSVNVHVQ
jgi:hypothetical protein